jgi:flagellar basal body-associated protein FliL
MIEKGYTPQRRKFGIPMERKSPARKIVIVALIVLGVAAAAVGIWLLVSKNAS